MRLRQYEKYQKFSIELKTYIILSTRHAFTFLCGSKVRVGDWHQPRVLLKDSLGHHPVMDEIVGALPLKAQHWIPCHNSSARGQEKRHLFICTDYKVKHDKLY